MHNLEDYFETTYEVSAGHLVHVRSFFDAASAILDKREDPSEEDLRAIVAKLRTRAHSIGTGQEIKDIPALLVMASGVQRSLVGKELVSCGFRVVTSDDPLEAISVAVSALPKFAIINKQLPGVSGIELCHVFKAVKVLSDCDIIVLTSDNDVEDIRRTVPDNTVIIHKDETFYEKLTDQLIGWGLFGEIT
jgi:CheY-like chemotaxis protein